MIMRLIASAPFVVASQNGFITADLPSERGRDIKKHYLRYTDDPILTDTTDKQSAKLSSRIGKIKSWKPPKSFMPLPTGALRRRRMSTGGSNRVSSAEKGSSIQKNECKSDSELHSKQNVRVSDDSKNKNWKQFLKVGFSALKSEIDEQQGTKTKQPADSTDSGSDNTSGKDRVSTVEQPRRISCNSAGSAIEW